MFLIGPKEDFSDLVIPQFILDIKFVLEGVLLIIVSIFGFIGKNKRLYS